MTDTVPPKRPVAAAGIVCFRDDAVLLVRRGAPPLAGRWSIPGGRIEWGERAADAALREFKEETNCTAELIGLIDVVDAVLTNSGAETEAVAPEPWAHYVLVDYAARWRAGEPIAGDDASEARFFSADELTGLGLWSETLRVIEAGRAMLKRAADR